MPFDFKKFDQKCLAMSVEELQREWEHYTRLISGAATSTTVSGLAIPFTLGVSTIGVGLAAPAIHNARKKREIIERHLNRLGATHVTRKRDVFTPMAISGTVGMVTLGVGSMGAGAITNTAMEHGFTAIASNEIAVKATTHLAVDAIAMVGEEEHMKNKKAAEAYKASQNFGPRTPGEQYAAPGTPGFCSETKFDSVPIPAAYDTRSQLDQKYSYGPTYGASSPSQCPPTPLPLYSPPPTSYSSLSPQPEGWNSSYFPPPPPGGPSPAWNSNPGFCPDQDSYRRLSTTAPLVREIDAKASLNGPVPQYYPAPLPTPAPTPLYEQDKQLYNEHTFSQQPSQMYPPPPPVINNHQIYPSYPGSIIPGNTSGQGVVDLTAGFQAMSVSGPTTALQSRFCDSHHQVHSPAPTTASVSSLAPCFTPAMSSGGFQSSQVAQQTYFASAPPPPPPPSRSPFQHHQNNATAGPGWQNSPHMAGGYHEKQDYAAYRPQGLNTANPYPTPQPTPQSESRLYFPPPPRSPRPT